jgi:type IV pilus assembly protein PilM
MVTLDIEDTSIRMMVVRGRQVEVAASLPLEPGLVRDGVIVDPVMVGRHIGELMAANGITEKKVMVSISGIHSIYRLVNVPKLPKKLLDEAAMREAERVMPVPLNELYTSWQTISISDIETAICLVGMPRNTVDAMLETLRQAGLQPEAMDVRPLALARVADEGSAIIINADQIGFDIVIMIDGIPELLRSLPFPAGTSSPDEKVSEVKEELDRTIAFYNSSHKASQITTTVATFISGELGDMLAQTLEYRIKPLPQLLSYTDSINTSEYAANIGLALRQARADSPTQVSLNVTPEAYMPKPFPLIQMVSWAFILVAAAILLLFGISTWQKYQETISLQNQVNSVRAQVQARQGTEASIKQLQTQIDAARTTGNAFTKPLDDAKAQRAMVNGSLSKVTSLLPGIIGLTSINYNTQSGTTTTSTLTVSGISPDDTTIVDYVRELRNSGQFSEVLITNMNEMEFNQWQFTLTLTPK